MGKRKIIIHLMVSVGLWGGMYGLILLESNLTTPWTKITNGLWFCCGIALIFFMSRGVYYLCKYIRGGKG